MGQHYRKSFPNGFSTLTKQLKAPWAYEEGALLSSFSYFHLFLPEALPLTADVKPIPGPRARVSTRQTQTTLDDEHQSLRENLPWNEVVCFGEH